MTAPAFSPEFSFTAKRYLCVGWIARNDGLSSSAASAGAESLPAPVSSTIR